MRFFILPIERQNIVGIVKPRGNETAYEQKCENAHERWELFK